MNGKLEIKNVYPLSPMQEGMLFHALADKDSTAYFQQLTIKIDGELSIPFVQQSFNKLIQRHEVLRTIFVHDLLEKPRQIVLKERSSTVLVQDLIQFSQDKQQSLIDEFCAQDRRKGFNLAKDMLTRIAILQLSANRYTLIWSFHHILMDGWCSGVLISEFFQIYRSLLENRQITLEKVYPYRNYIKWLQKQDNDDASRFWRDYLQGYSEHATFPRYLLTSVKQGDESAEQQPVQKVCSFIIDQNLTRKLKKIAENYQVTINTICQVVWGILLQKYNNLYDIIFGSVVAGRPAEIEGIEKMIGLFINTIPLRVTTIPGQSFGELVKDVQQKFLIAANYSYYPLAKIQANSEFRKVLIDHIIDFTNYPLDQSIRELGVTDKLPLTITGVEMFEQSNYDLDIAIVPMDEIKFIIYYNSLCYDNEFIQKTPGHLMQIFQAITKNTEIRIQDIELVTTEEKKVILNYGTKPIFKRRDNVIQRISRIAEKYWDEVAVTYNQKQITYGELELKTNQLAWFLRKRGVKSEDIVGIMMENSSTFLITLLGILKSEGAYLPIDLDYPTERIEYMLKDSNTQILLTVGNLISEITFEGDIIDLTDQGIFDSKEASEITWDIKEHDLAYIIYTSGSTGKPKGVMVEHRNLFGYVDAYLNEYRLTPEDVVLQSSSYAFDASIEEIFPILTIGGRLVIANKDQILDINLLAELIRQNQVTIIVCPPLLLKELNQFPPFESVRVFASGADVLKKEYFSNVINYSTVYNSYGPTENTVCSAFYFCTGEELTSIPIGKTIGNYRIYILSRDGKLCPVGIPGEIHLGGAGLTRGYLNRPDLTAEKFIPDPFKPGEKVYKSGDRGRWLSGGNVEFLGRIDRQVKIRGFRIELGEIEYHLLNYPKITEVVLVADENHDGNKCLAAYIVSTEDFAISELREYLAELIPKYMIPSYFIRINEIPKSFNGKVDVKQLPKPEESISLSKEFFQPQTELEQVLAEVWSRVLGVEQIGIKDNFFDLGGDSIKAIQILALLRKNQVKLEIKDLFDYPTIEGLIPHLKTLERQIAQDLVTGKIPLTPIQKQFWSSVPLENRFCLNHYNQSVMLYNQNGFDPTTLQKVLKQIVEHHDILRVYYQFNAGEVTQINRGLEGELFRFHMEDLRKESEHWEIITRQSEMIQRNINLSTGPLIHIGLFKTKEGDHLLMTVHHLVIDGISFRVLLEDLASGYLQASQDKSIQFQQKTDSFKTWATSLQKYANSEKLLDELNFWSSQEEILIKPLINDDLTEVDQYRDAKNQEIQLSVEETNHLLHRVNRAYNTEINDILLSGLALSIQRWFNTEQILLSLEGHGREEIIQDVDITRTIGWFTTVFPLIFKIPFDTELSTCIKLVKERLRKIPNRGIGYGILRYLTDEESRNGVNFRLKPEIAFNYLGQFDQSLNTPDFSLSEIQPERTVSERILRPHFLEIISWIRDRRLHLSIGYNQHQFSDHTIISFLNLYRDQISQIISHCSTKEIPELTPSDLGDKTLTLFELDWIQSQVGSKGNGQVYPLTPLQEGLLFHYLFDSNSHAYFEQTVITVKGQLQVNLLQDSYNILLQRYDIFRTVFLHENLQRPRQVIKSFERVEVYFADISALSKYERESYLTRFLEQDHERGFDLQSDLPIRLGVVKTAGDCFEIIWSFHHIILDGWSMSIINAEFMRIYSSLSNDETLQLPEVEQFSQYIKWLESQDRKQAKQYWKSYTKDYIEKASLPKNNPQWREDNLEVGMTKELTFALDTDLTTRLQNICELTHITMNTLCQVIWGLILQKYNNSQDVIFGYVTSGRSAQVSGIEQMVGLFINTIPVRIKAEIGCTVRKLIQKTQQSLLHSAKYDYYSLPDIQAETLLKTNLIDHIMVFENYPIDKQIQNLNQRGQLGFEIIQIKTFEKTNYDFNLIFVLTDQLQVVFKFTPAIYEEEFITRIRGHFIKIAEQIAVTPDILLKDIDLLTTQEKEEILFAFNNTQSEYPQNKTIHQLFEEQLLQYPEQIAVATTACTGKLFQQLTYRKLNMKANQLGLFIREKGVEPESIVGIVAERSLEMVIGIMAVLKAGGAYLPIYPGYPTERIEYMLKDSRVKVVLTTGDLLKEVKFYGQIINLQDQEPYQNSVSTANLNSTVNPNNLAYVIYTSGSTGSPKGVMVEHQSLVNFFYGFYNLFGQQIGKEDRCLWVTNISFDVNVYELFLPLLFGARLVVVDDQYSLDVLSLTRTIIEEGITCTYLPPTLLEEVHTLLSANKESIQLNKLLVGVEPIMDYVLEKYLTLNPMMQILNGYGPTEATICATVYKYESKTPLHKRVLIGKPLANNQIYILDKENQLTPIGVSGELCIAGAGLARGYVNNSALTAEKFVPNLVKSGERIYRTGDLGRWDIDGNIEFISRLDRQMKIRGYRIEPSEIEAEILKIPGIRETIVQPLKDIKGQISLIAYLVSSKSEFQTSEVRKTLQKRLPDYMIPTYFVPIPSIPVTPSGKIDYARLPDPRTIIDIHQLAVQPTTELEAQLTRIWRELLQVETVGITDNFFELGGHSLKATQLSVRILQEFHVELPLRTIFQIPTIKEMAGYLQNTEKDIWAPLRKVRTQTYYPLSSAQKRLFILNQLDRTQINYNIPGIVLIDGEVDVDRLNKAFRNLIIRHQSLRTSFELKDGEPVQKIHSFKNSDEVNFKLSQPETMVQHDQLPELIKKFITPFILSELPLFRVGLIKTNSQMVMIVDMHHIVTDGVSMNILVRDVMDLYAEKELPELKTQYTDYTVWHNRLLESGQLQSQEDYWLNLFTEPIPILDLPTDYTRPVVKKFAGDRISFQIDAKITTRIRELALEKGSTLFILLLACYNVLLAKYASEEDIIVGIPVAGRRHGDLENLIGMFVNTLALRNNPHSELTFSQFLNQVKESTLEAYENQDYPFELLVEKLNLQRELNRNPLFETMFVLQNVFISELVIPELKFSPYQYNDQIAKFDLTLFAREDGRTINLTIEYSSELFKKEMIQRFGRHFINLVRDVGANPDIQLAHIQLVTPEERTLLLHRFNNTLVNYPKEKTIKSLFEDQMKRYSENLALVFGSEELTYEEVNNRANRMARMLRSKGVGPEKVVGIIAQRSIETIIGVLAIVKAGGAYLPIDPDDPEKRIEFLLQDSRAFLVLIPDEMSKSVQFVGEIINLKNWENKAINSSNLDDLTESHSLLYIIYTSGSTGKPKGVMIEHSNVNRLISNSNMFAINANDRFLQTSSLAFDASTFEVWGTLLNGATLYLISKDDLLMTSCLRERIRSYKITILWLTTAFFHQLVEQDVDIFQDLKTLIFGGEVLSVKHCNLVRNKFKELEILHAYGPTESTTFTTYFPVLQEYQENVPIGKPVSNTQIFILDTNNLLQPLGVIGELCISGDGLARGYLNDSQLTKEKFIPHPFIPGERLYKSGDLARWLEDGTLEFRGRIDHQVKIRGYRVEVSEIEHQLNTHSKITGSVVTVFKDLVNHKHLCAYLVTEHELSTVELRGYLAEKLPDYMIPTHFTIIDQIPLKSNGKIDYKELPEPAVNNLTADSYLAPMTETEVKLTSIWSQILGVKKIGMEDNFFELGGHSLKATLVAAQILSEFQVEIPLREIFKNPTIRGVSEYITLAEKGRYSKIEKISEREYYPVSSAQKRLFLLDQLGYNLNYNMPTAFIIKGELDVIRLEEAVQRLIQRHQAFRTTFSIINGEIIQRIHPKIDFQIDYIENYQDSLDNLIKEFIRPFDLTQAPLLRVKMVKGKVNLLILDLHHIISDGVSMEIMVIELISLYQGQELSDLTIQYADYTVWHNQLLKSELIKEQEEYWLKVFADEIPVLNLPTNFIKNSGISLSGACYRFELGEEMTDKLNQMAFDNNATLFMILIALYNTLLARYTGQEDIVVGFPIAGRNHPDLTGVIGMFVNTLVLRSYPVLDKPFKFFLSEVRDRVLQAFENQDYPFEMLVEKLNLQRELDKNPLFDTMFVLQRTDVNKLYSPGLEFIPFEYEERIAKFDLTFTIIEGSTNLIFEVEYKPTLFKESTIQGLARHYVNIIKNVVSYPEVLLGDVKLLSPDEENLLINEFNRTAQNYLKDKTTDQIFEEQVVKTPGKNAIVYEGEDLTYEVLNNRANQLARVLYQYNIQPDQIVGIMVEPSLEMIIGILAILKSGAAYLPIDPDYPQSRIQYMLADSGTDILLTQKHLGKLTDFAMQVLYIDDEEVYQGPTDNLTRNHTTENLIYLMYTSGSTGQPKAVMVEHRGIVNFILHLTSRLEMDEEDRMLQFFEYTFDASVLNIFTSLFSGAALYLVSKEVIGNYILFEDYLNQNQITTINLPPIYLNNLNPERVITVTKILTGGAPATYQIVYQWRQKGKYFNVYGPTECSICSTLWEIDEREELPTEKLIPIGRPVANTRIYILNQRNQIQPIGVFGEVCIVGVGVSRGYMNRDELTKEKFVPDPFNPQEIMYRTGDLATFTSDGNIQFAGRIDNQVKIRGYRIELGEIEHRLLSYPVVRDTVVISRIATDGDRHLVAYLVTRGELSVENLRGFLKQTLPEYMIPAYFVIIDQIPLTINGKVDFKRLPERPGELEDEYVMPTNPLEEQLVEIWSEILSTERIGTMTNFFSIGGHSLKATQLVVKIMEELQIHISLRDVFTYPTIKELAEELIKRVKRSYEQEESIQRQDLVLLKHGKINKHIFLIHDGSGEIDVYLPFSTLSTIDINYWGVRFIKRLSKFTIEDLATEYIQKIKTIQPEGPYNIAGFSSGGMIAFEMVSQLEINDEEIGLFAMFDSAPPEKVSEQEKAEMDRRWQGGLQFLNANPEEMEVIKGMIPEDLAQLIPDQNWGDMNSLKDSLKMIKVLAQASIDYLPQNRLRKSLFYFDAKDSGEFHTGWEQFLVEPLILYHLPGGHHDIFKKPIVAELMKIFDGVYNDIF